MKKMFLLLMLLSVISISATETNPVEKEKINKKKVNKLDATKVLNLYTKKWVPIKKKNEPEEFCSSDDGLTVVYWTGNMFYSVTTVPNWPYDTEMISPPNLTLSQVANACDAKPIE